MNAAADLVFEKIVDEAVALDTRFPRKGAGDNKDAKVAFSRAGRTPMSGVKLGLVDNVESRRAKLHHQFFAKALGNGHSVLLSFTVDTI